MDKSFSSHQSVRDPTSAWALFLDLSELASNSQDLGATPNQASPADLDQLAASSHDFSASSPYHTYGPYLWISAN